MIKFKMIKKILILLSLLIITSCIDVTEKPIKKIYYKKAREVIMLNDTLSKYEKRYVHDNLPKKSEKILNENIDSLLQQRDSIINSYDIFFNSPKIIGNIAFNKPYALFNLYVHVDKKLWKIYHKKSRTNDLKFVEIKVFLKHYKCKKPLLDTNFKLYKNDDKKRSFGILTYEGYNKKFGKKQEFTKKLYSKNRIKDDNLINKLYKTTWRERPIKEFSERDKKTKKDFRLWIRFCYERKIYITKIAFKDTVFSPNLEFYKKYMPKKDIKN